MANAFSTDVNQPSTQLITWQEKLEKAQIYKAEGNTLYQNENHKAAIGKYHRSLLYIKGIESALQGLTMGMGQTPQAELASRISEAGKMEMQQLKIACYNNLAACLLLTENPNLEKVVQHCNNVIEVAPSNVKALYRKGQALFRLGDTDQAQETLMKAARLPEGAKDAKIRQLLQTCAAKRVEEDKKVRQTYKSMFEQLSIDDTASDPTAVEGFSTS